MIFFFISVRTLPPRQLTNKNIRISYLHLNILPSVLQWSLCLCKLTEEQITDQINSASGLPRLSLLAASVIASIQTG
jgi:hypothetical protein